MVASTHWLGTAAGMSILEKGGNAFDAAVATGLTLQVVEPSMAGPAGDAPIIFYDAKADDVRVICGQGVAPEKATIGAIGVRCESNGFSSHLWGRDARGKPRSGGRVGAREMTRTRDIAW